ncbi:MAG: hypothetical protein LBQ84_08425 [Flavobacteriaceae bacterium]|jgi:uncharacterized membrane protein|nr:hypothetical protein [Flavobacteriaceae bacterium]
MEIDLLQGLNEQLKYVWANYGLIIALVMIGFGLGFFFKEYVSDRNYKKQIELRIKEKDAYIGDLKQLVSERISKVSVEQKDVTFFNKLKKFFKRNNI